MNLRLGLKSDPIEYRYSFPWLFRLMAEEGITSLQLGSFFEVYQLPDEYFLRLRKQAGEYGVTIDSLFTAHRELGGFFREDPEWVDVARRNYERYIEVGALLGARAVGSNPGAVPRDRMELKAAGVRRYLDHMKELMVFARDRGVEWLTIEPMSCLAEPPTLPDEIAMMGEELTAFHRENEATTARVGYCTDIAHGYLDEKETRPGYSPMELFEATLPWLYEVHLKNTDERYHSTFGFGEAELAKGIIDVGQFRRTILERASELPVDELVGYLEVGGPKLGRDYSDPGLAEQLRVSLRYLRQAFLEGSETSAVPGPGMDSVVSIQGNPAEGVLFAPSMMCADPLAIGESILELEEAGADLLHLDIMDGHFVPNAPMGLAVVKAAAERSRLPVDVHLMVDKPDDFLALMEGWGVDRISVHAEACGHLDRTLARIREMGAKAGLALNPSTPPSVLEFVLDRLDFVLVMTVNPGFAGQAMTPASLRKIADCRALLSRLGHGAMEIQVDGNVSFANIPAMVAAGARNLVAGTSSVFAPGASLAANLARARAAAAEGLREPEVRS